jgi:hypothetical protein
MQPKTLSEKSSLKDRKTYAREDALSNGRKHINGREVVYGNATTAEMTALILLSQHRTPGVGTDEKSFLYLTKVTVTVAALDLLPVPHPAALKSAAGKALRERLPSSP